MGVGSMLSTCGDYVEHMLIFAQCSINILSNHKKVTSTQIPTLDSAVVVRPEFGERPGWAVPSLGPPIQRRPEFALSLEGRDSLGEEFIVEF